MTDHKLQAVADSAWLKVVQYVVTGVAAPLLVWFMNATLARLEKIEASTSLATLQGATFELRIKALEAQGIERQAAISMLSEQVMKHGFEIRRLAEERARAEKGR